jgi:hypothetical protein
MYIGEQLVSSLYILNVFGGEGLCGLPYFVMDANQAHKFVGIHIAGVPNRSLSGALPILLPDIELLMKNFSEQFEVRGIPEGLSQDNDNYQIELVGTRKLPKKLRT